MTSYVTLSTPTASAVRSFFHGVLMLAAIALIVAKLAGLISWPWAAVLVPAALLTTPIWLSLTIMLAAAAIALLGVILTGLIYLFEAAIDWNRRRKRLRG